MSESKATGLPPYVIPHVRDSQKLLGQIDWSKSPLGDIQRWPDELNVSVSLCLNSSLPVAVWWTQDLILLYNEAFRKILRLKHPEQFGLSGKQIGLELWETLSHSLQTVFKTGISTEVHYKMINNASDVTHIRFNNTPIYDRSEKVAGIFTTVVPSPKSSQQEALRKTEENEAKLKMAIEATGLGTWDYNPLSGELIWSDRCREIYALPTGQAIDFKTFTEQIHPDDKTFVEAEIAKSMNPEQGGKYDIVYRILRFNDRSTRWIRAQGKVYFNEFDQPERLIGTVLDITDQKLHDNRLKENELKMQLTMQASAMGAYEWDLVTSEFQYSARLAQIFGYKETSNLKQHDFVDRIHPEDLKIRQRAHETAFETGVLYYEARIVWPDGSIRWVQINGMIIFDEHDKPQRMYGTVLDISESKLQSDALEQKIRERTKLLEDRNEQLKRSEERYIKMTEEVQDYAIILLDKDGTIINWNKGAEKIKGYHENEIIGKNFSIFYLEEDRKNALPKNLIDRAVAEGRAMHEGWRKRKDGTKFWGSIVITALHDHQNNIIGFTKVTRDLTERKVAEDVMKQHTLELEIKNKQLEQFAYIASHDLQEPLRKIQTFIHVLEAKLGDPEARKKYFTKITSSAKRMSDLIQAVLNYSRLSHGEAVFVPADLNSILENVKIDYELIIAEKNATIRSDTLPVMKGIPLQLSQLFSNLIGNSLKFSKGHPVITISFEKVAGKALSLHIPSVDASRNYAVLTFRDNGIGFEQRYAEKIFTIFQRLHSRDNYAGTGIGLALCKRIVENHHGFIQAKSQIGKGATFIVYLPFE